MIIISLFLTIPIVLSSCWKDQADNIPMKPNRTVLFYMAGDNSLRGEMQEKIDALTEAWNIDGNNHLLIYEDKGLDQTPCLLEIKNNSKGKGEIKVLKEYTKEENSASPEVFSRVLNDMILFYPGSDYGLVMFSHGSGWLPEGIYSSNTRSIAMDGQQEFDLQDFAKCIPQKQFRFIIFESCLMASVEVAYELLGKADYILASSAEIVSPGFTPLYKKLLPLIYSYNPDLETFAVEYFNYYNSLSNDMRSATISVIRPSELIPLKKMLSQAEKRIENWSHIKRDDIQAFDRHSTHLFYDLESYLKQIGTPQENITLANILKKSIIYRASTEHFMPSTIGGFEIKEHCGLTIYIPIESFVHTEKYKELNLKRKRLMLFSENNG